MRFAITLVLVTALYLRPWELVEGYEQVQAYEAIILACLAVSAVPVLRQVVPAALAARPITFCVVGFAPAVFLSLAGQGDAGEAVSWARTVVKLVLLYLVLVANLDTPGRMRAFVAWLGLLIVGLAGLSLLHYHGAINVPALEAHQQREFDAETGDVAREYGRLCGPGIFHDPNDFCAVLVIGVMACLYWVGERRLGPARFAWLAPVGVLGYAVSLTHSRGGFLALAAALTALGVARWGWKKAAFAGLVLGPALLAALAGRATTFDLDNPDDTGQSRIRIWSDGLVLLRNSPVFGIGQGRFVDEVGITAHNTYLEVYTQTGLVGGSLFVGALAYGFWALARLKRVSPGQPDLARLRPFVLAMLAAMAAGMLSVSRDVTQPTYVMLAVVAAYLGLASAGSRVPLPPLTPRLVAGMLAVSFVLLLAIHSFTVLVIRR